MALRKALALSALLLASAPLVAATLDEGKLDPAWFGGCWMPPSQCPPLERAADGGTPLVLPFTGLPAGAPCLLAASPIGSAPVLPPCFQVGHEVLGIVVADPAGRAVFTVPTAPVRLGLVGVVSFARAQVYALDPSWSVAPPVLASSRVLQVEARF